MRILFWTKSFWPTIGGLEVLGTEQALELRRRGHEVLVVAQHDGGELPELDSYAEIPIHRLPFHGALERADLEQIVRIRSRIDRIFEEFSPDIIHMHTLGPDAVFCPGTRGATGPPLLVTRHVLFEEGQSVAPDTLPHRVLSAADWVACPTQAVREEVVGLVPSVEPRSSVIPNGAVFPDLEPSDLDFDPPRLICLGRLVPLKGFDLAIDALAEIRGSHPDAELLVVGDGPARADLEDRARQRGVHSHVEFAGWVTPADVYRYLNRCAILLSPSRVGEAFCVAALQAAQMARPVIGSRLGGLPEVVRDGVSGVLVEPDSSEAIAGALTMLLENPESARTMGRAGRGLATSLTIERYTDRYERLYETLTRETNQDVAGI